MRGNTARNRATGHLYVVKFASGLVKVGCGIDWRPRVGQHLAEGRRHGNPWKAYWTSTRLPRMAAAERGLVSWCKRQPAVERCSNEWFYGLPFREAVQCAEAIAAQHRAELRDCSDPSHVGTFTMALAPADRYPSGAVAAAERYRTTRGGARAVPVGPPVPIEEYPTRIPQAVYDPCLAAL